jgi:hypothetical protein
MADSVLLKAGGFEVLERSSSYLAPQGGGIQQEVAVTYDGKPVGNFRIPGKAVDKLGTEPPAARHVRAATALQQLGRQPRLREDLRGALDSLVKQSPQLFPKPAVPTTPAAAAPKAPAAGGSNGVNTRPGTAAAGIPRVPGAGLLGAFGAIGTVVSALSGSLSVSKYVDHILEPYDPGERDRRLNEVRTSVDPATWELVQWELSKRLSKPEII